MQTRTFDGGLQGVGRDVTELRNLEQRLVALALRDPLTGLANRRLLKELLDADLARTHRAGAPLAVAYLDLDDFKSVNDTDVGVVVPSERRGGRHPHVRAGRGDPDRRRRRGDVQSQALAASRHPARDARLVGAIATR